MNILRTHRCNIEFDKGDDSMITNRSRFAIKFTLKMFCSNFRTVFCFQSLVVSYKFVVLVFHSCFFAEHGKMTFFSLMKLHFILSFHFMVYQEKFIFISSKALFSLISFFFIGFACMRIIEYKSNKRKHFSWNQLIILQSNQIHI